MEGSDLSSIVARGRLAVIRSHLFASTEKSSNAILGTSAVFAAQPQPNLKGSLTVVDERTDENYQVQVSNEGTLKATDFKKVTLIQLLFDPQFATLMEMRGSLDTEVTQLRSWPRAVPFWKWLIF